MSCKKDKVMSLISQKCVKKCSITGFLLQDIKNTLREQVKYINSLPNYLKDTIRWYTMSMGIYNFNKYIREKEEHKKYNPEFQYHSNNFRYIFDNVPPIKKALNVFRGVDKKEFLLYNNSYLSTSLIYNTTANFIKKKTCCVLSLTIPAGAKILPLFTISEISEAEILLDMNSSIYITGSYKHKNMNIYTSSFIPKIAVLSDNKDIIQVKSTLELQHKKEKQYVSPIVDDSKYIYNTIDPHGTTVSKLQKIYKKYINSKKISIPSKRGVRVLTYNIHNGFYNTPSTKNNYNKIIDFIEDTNADIVNLQELMWNEHVDRDTLVEDMKKIGYNNYFICKASDINGFFGNATFSKFYIVKRKKLNLGKDPENDEGRSACVVKVELPNNKKLTVVNTHLDVWDDTGKFRKRQLGKIFEYLKGKKSPVVITGDFNTIRPEDYSEKYLNWLIANRSGIDVFEMPQLDLDTLDIFKEHKFDDITDVTKQKISITSWTGKRIDYMYINEYINVYRSFAVSIDYSDHLPLIGDLNI